LMRGGRNESSVGDSVMEPGDSIGDGDFLVDRRFCLVWSKWPLIVASEIGECFWRDCRGRRPAKLGTWPRRRASSNVDRAGLKRVACTKATRSVVVALPSAAWADIGIGWWMSSSQSLVVGVWWPCMTIVLLWQMVTVEAVKVMSQLASQS